MTSCAATGWKGGELMIQSQYPPLPDEGRGSSGFLPFSLTRGSGVSQVIHPGRDLAFSISHLALQFIRRRQ